MPWKLIIYLSIAAVLAAGLYFAWKLTARGAYESAEYTLLESDGPFELREYPDLMMATTRMPADSQGGDGSFMRLFQYISGANEKEQKIAMTTPVFMEAEAEDDRAQMGFVLPEKIAAQRPPDPSNEAVDLRQRVGGRFAVLRFAGRMDSQSVAKREAELRDWIGQKGLAAVEAAETAGYDPPWTPGPFRRNEVLIRLK